MTVHTNSRCSTAGPSLLAHTMTFFVLVFSRYVVGGSETWKILATKIMKTLLVLTLAFVASVWADDMVIVEGTILHTPSSFLKGVCFRALWKLPLPCFYIFDASLSRVQVSKTAFWHFIFKSLMEVTSFYDCCVVFPVELFFNCCIIK